MARLLVISAVLTVLGRSRLLSAEVLEENALDGCGVGHGSLHSTAYGWQYTPCWSENNGACFVKAHEERYHALVRACEEAHSNQSSRIRQYRADFPQYSSDVIVALSQLNVTLQTQRDRLESIVQDQHDVLVNTTAYAAQLERDIVVASVEANRTDQAVQHYVALLEPTAKELVRESYAAHQESSSISSSRKVALLLRFARTLPDAAERTAVYRQLDELLQTDQQDERFPGVLLSEDAPKHSEHRPDPERYPKRALARWQRQLLDGFFAELVQFAGDYPDYYARIEPALLRDLVTERWSAEGWPRLVQYPNALPRPEQRVRAFQVLLGALQRHAQQQQLPDLHVMQLADEVSKLERALTGDPPEALRQQLTELTEHFTQLTYERSFLTYAELFALYKPAV
uniref:Putative secreted protein n=3 Tax=oswaldoi series TaxID=44548 RepID=A0A2M3ZXR8_9DIPT